MLHFGVDGVDLLENRGWTRFPKTAISAQLLVGRHRFLFDEATLSQSNLVYTTDGELAEW